MTECRFESEIWRFRLPKDEIGYLRFLMEAYEGVAQVTSRPGEAEVHWVVPTTQRQAAAALARALADEIGLEPIAGPLAK